MKKKYSVISNIVINSKINANFNDDSDESQQELNIEESNKGFTTP